MTSRTRLAAPFCLLSTLGREAVGTGAAPLVFVAAGLVFLSPQLAIFTLGNRLAARQEALTGSLIGILAFTSTMVAILLVRVLLEEKTLDQLTAMGASPALVGVSMCGALFLLAAWQTLVLLLVGLGTLSERTAPAAGALLLVVAGLAGVRPIFTVAASGRFGGLRSNALTPLALTLAGAWFLGAVWLLLGAWGGGGLRMLLSLLATTAWGSMIGLLLGSRLAVPQALTAAFAVWAGWSAFGSLMEKVIGPGVSPLLPWSALLATEGVGLDAGWFMALAGSALAAWATACFLTPVILASTKGSVR